MNILFFLFLKTKHTPNRLGKGHNIVSNGPRGHKPEFYYYFEWGKKKRKRDKSLYLKYDTAERSKSLNF